MVIITICNVFYNMYLYNIDKDYEYVILVGLAGCALIIAI